MTHCDQTVWLASLWSCKKWLTLDLPLIHSVTTTCFWRSIWSNCVSSWREMGSTAWRSAAERQSSRDAGLQPWVNCGFTAGVDLFPRSWRARKTRGSDGEVQLPPTHQTSQPTCCWKCSFHRQLPTRPWPAQKTGEASKEQATTPTRLPQLLTLRRCWCVAACLSDWVALQVKLQFSKDNISWNPLHLRQRYWAITAPCSVRKNFQNSYSQL